MVAGRQELRAALRLGTKADLGCWWLFTSYKVWADSYLFFELGFLQLTPRNLPIPTSSDFFTHCTDHSDE